MADIKLKDKQATETTYSGVSKVLIPKADGSGNQEFSIGGGGGNFNINQIVNGDTSTLQITDASGGVTDTPLTITENGITNTPDGIRYNPITVNVSGGGGGGELGWYDVTVDATSASDHFYVGFNAEQNSGLPLLNPDSTDRIRTRFTIPNKTNLLSFHSTGRVPIYTPGGANISTNPLNSIIELGYQPSATANINIFGYKNRLLLIKNDCTITIIYSCLLPDTLITLADGSRKPIKDITYRDELKVWDFDSGEFSTAPICWLTRSGLHNDHMYRLTFSDGSVVDFTGHKSNHKIYNVDKRKFEGVNVTEIGDRIFSENGIVTVTNKEYIEQDVEYYNLITKGNINCFCNGILAADRYGNMYPIDEDMKYVKGGRIIRPYSEFEPHKIKRYWYDTLRLGEIDEDINDTINYIGKLECQMLPLPEKEVN